MKFWLLVTAPIFGAVAACNNVVVQGAGAASSGSADSGGVSTNSSTGAGAGSGGSSASPCLVGGNVLYLDGDPGNPFHPGQETLEGEAWVWTLHAAPVAAPSFLSFTLQNMQANWALEFASTQLAGMPPLDVQAYADAMDAPTASPGHPGLLVFGYPDSTPCGSSGKFQIETISAEYAVTAFTATFEQWCEQPGPVLRGCVHFEP